MNFTVGIFVQHKLRPGCKLLVTKKNPDGTYECEDVRGDKKNHEATSLEAYAEPKQEFIEDSESEGVY